MKEKNPKILLKENEYKNYINRHCLEVVRAYNKFFIPVVHGHFSEVVDLHTAILQAGKLVLIHDLSKFSDEEFQPYRINFFPTEDETNAFISYRSIHELNAPLFDIAWQHHIKFNPHHPEYWSILSRRDMPLEYIIEMICDWIAVGTTLNTSTKEWWQMKAQSDEALHMTPKTIDTVNNLLFNVLLDVP